MSDVRAADSDLCDCGHRRDEHDGAGCFADPETCECAREPGLFPGERDDITPVAAARHGEN